MGYSYGALTRILDKGDTFRGKKIVSLGTLYPYITKKESRILVKRGLRFDLPKEQFSKHLFIDLLGASVCHSLDVSDYQKSEIICNLNHPLPRELVGQYDVVIDSGTLEHLSNLSIALENLFKLLKNGGIYYFSTPCNNWVDHGFFQFSPTFFIDLCFDNPNLELSDIHISTSNKNYYLMNLNPAFKRALFTSHQRIGVGGVIKKSSDNITFDLIQSKYREQYIAPALNTSITESIKFPFSSRGAFRRFASTVIMRFSISSWVPLCLKEVILNQLYRFK